MKNVKQQMIDETLIAAAKEASACAYAPYSGYYVGAALLGADGNIYSGCNVENVSFSVGICAERTAIVKMVSNGCREIVEVALATQDKATPCGLCLQTIYEFVTKPSEVKIHCVSNKGDQHTYLLSELLPHGFQSNIVGKHPVK
jgi:cytidine deaminase